MQTDEGSGQGLLKIPKNAYTSDTDCFSTADIRGHFDKDSTSVSDYSDSGSSDSSFSSGEDIFHASEKFPPNAIIRL